MSVSVEGVAAIRRTFAAHIPLYLCSAIFTVLRAYGIDPMFEEARIFLIAFSIFLGMAGILALTRELWALIAGGFPPDRCTC